MSDNTKQTTLDSIEGQEDSFLEEKVHQEIQRHGTGEPFHVDCGSMAAYVKYEKNEYPYLKTWEELSLNNSHGHVEIVRCANCGKQIV